MRLICMMALAAFTLQAESHAGDPPQKMDRVVLARVTDGIDNSLKQLWPDYPAELVGVTQVVYIRGYGAVLAGEVNLAPGLGITPFHPNITKDDITKTRNKKMERMAALRNAMQDLLMKSAAELRDVPDNEEIVLGVSLFYWHWEARGGLPDQVVMHAPKKALLAVGRDKAALALAVHLEEY